MAKITPNRNKNIKIFTRPQQHIVSKWATIYDCVNANAIHKLCMYNCTRIKYDTFLKYSYSNSNEYGSRYALIIFHLLFYFYCNFSSNYSLSLAVHTVPLAIISIFVSSAMHRIT